VSVTWQAGRQAAGAGAEQRETIGQLAVLPLAYAHDEGPVFLQRVSQISRRTEKELDLCRLPFGDNQRGDGEPGAVAGPASGDDGHRCRQPSPEPAHRVALHRQRRKRLSLVDLSWAHGRKGTQNRLLCGPAPPRRTWRPWTTKPT